MAKNIVVYSDGTGQDGGVRPEQRISNVYKMYHASRVHPDNAIVPESQVVFYDPGLGTDSGVTGLTSIIRRVRKLLQSVTGRGITNNIADCYEFIINHYDDGDRIYLIGFSRGAYTVRCLANTLMLCGVPTHAADGSKLLRFRKGIHDIAKEAVDTVYEHGAGHARADYETERDEQARRFREKYGSNYIGKTDDPTRSNAAAYFVGVFDTVAALGASGARRFLIQIGLVILFGVPATIISALLAALLALFSNFYFGYSYYWSVLLLTGVFDVIAIGWFAYHQRAQYTKTIYDYPEKGQQRSHQAEWKSEHFDRLLSMYVGTARSANAIDETRMDFDRVAWGQKDSTQLSQMWFAGNHSDIGGSYPETESRLSDIALQWMIEEALKLEHPIKLGPVHVHGNLVEGTGPEGTPLHLFPDIAGVQHCEIAGTADMLAYTFEGWPKLLRGWLTSRNYKIIRRKIIHDANIHSTVVHRFKMAEVVNCAKSGEYRPEALREHDNFKQYYPPLPDGVEPPPLGRH